MVVSRGVLGAQFGAGALGGAVELLPRWPRGAVRGGAQVSGGSFGTAQAALGVAGPLGKGGSAVVAVQADRTAGDFDYARQLTPGIPGSPYYGFTRENADAARGSGLARLAPQLAGAGELAMILQGSLGDPGLPGQTCSPTTPSP